jgi:hypothetical protein
MPTVPAISSLPLSAALCGLCRPGHLRCPHPCSTVRRVAAVASTPFTLSPPGCSFARGACSWAAGAQFAAVPAYPPVAPVPYPFPRLTARGGVDATVSRVLWTTGQAAPAWRISAPKRGSRPRSSLRIHALFPPVIECLVLYMWKAAALRTSCKGRGAMCPEGPSPSDQGVYHISPSYWRTFLSEAECGWRTTNADAAVAAVASTPLHSLLPGCGFARRVFQDGPARRWRAGLSIPSDRTCSACGRKWPRCFHLGAFHARP